MLKEGDTTRGSSILKEERLNIWVSFIMALLASVGSLLLVPPEQSIMLPNNPKPLIIFPRSATISLSVIFGIFCWGVTMVLVAYFRMVLGRRKEQEALVNFTTKEVERSVSRMTAQLTDRLTCVEERLPKMRELTAFFTDSNKLESHLEYLHKAPGGLAWIVAKFISEKISNSFVKKWTIEIDASRYSSFAAKLYGECGDSIYLTNPFTPRQWFMYLADRRVEDIKKGTQLSREETPEHVHALLNSPARRKKRLVILDDSVWSEVECDSGCQGTQSCLEKFRLLKEFLRVNGENLDGGESVIETRFAKASDIKEDIPGYVPTTDYAIFDKQLALRWEDMPGSTQEGASETANARKHKKNARKHKNLILSPELSETERELIVLFETKVHKHLVNAKDLLARLSHAPNAAT
jgi:hypothetical protein